MNETLLPITFLDLLSNPEHERIRIPRLQRDYAQGRKGTKETEIRTIFLEVLRKALESEVDANFTPLNLDFVYGSVETLPDKHFSPLDGQQRLTTLFLLHWYLAWRDGCWENFTLRFREGEHSRFAYRVRTSSNEFFDQLVQHRPPMPAAALLDLKDWITDQPWYFRYWRLDPTIEAVLEMLQEMHTRFKGTENLYARLTDTARPAITFQLLNLGVAFPLSDDLYIKMNARGEPLTPFESFKALYEQKLPEHFTTDERRDIDGVLFAMSDFVARRMDTAWTNFFWQHNVKQGQFDPKRVDKSFMNVFRIVALVSRDPTKETYSEDIKLLRDSENPPTYSTFKARGWLDPDFSALLVSLMEAWCASEKLLPPDSLFEESAICRQIFENPAKLSVPQVVLFCGYALFIHKHDARLYPAQFAAWMRVVRNLGLNSDIDSNALLQNASKGLRELLQHSLDILPRIADFDTQGRITGFSNLQQGEEALKACLLLAAPAGWTPLIERAERHRYFSGQIEFLLEFSGVAAQRAKTGDCAWDAGTHLGLQRSFLTYFEKAEVMFDAKGLVDLGEQDEARWQRALLSIGDYLLQNGWSNMSFLVNDVSKTYGWKRLLRDSGDKRCTLQQLWDHLKYDQPIPANLDAVIASATGLEPWREALVRNPGAVLYCNRGNIQRDGNHVILLSSERRSAPHAELFTFLLHSKLQPPAPFTLGEYFFRGEPHFLLHFPWGNEQFSFEIYGRYGDFDLWIQLPIPPDLQALIEQNASFALSKEYPDWLVRTVLPADIESVVHDIAAQLNNP